MKIKRYLAQGIHEDLADKMVFIGGPRQVGKTTLARMIGENQFKSAFEYLNWDNRDDRKAIMDSRFSPESRMIIFDEIHKYRDWKNYVKGLYDKNKDKFSIVVTGSSRLDIFRRGGDSLLGRYHYYRLHPLTLSEISGGADNFKPFTSLKFGSVGKDAQNIFNRLYKFGGFPEVYIKHDEKELRRWHNERVDRLVKEDIRDVEIVRDLGSLQLLAELLKDKVGSQFSINSLTEDLRTTHKTAAYWVEILEKFYYHFRVYSYQSTKIRSLRKEPKLYLWDWSEVVDDGARFENLIAMHLLKFCHFLHDSRGYSAQLHYLRDREQREVDFLITVDNKPWFCVEAKSSFNGLSSSLNYFSDKLKIPFAFQVVKDGDVDFVKNNIRVMNVLKFLTAFI